MAPLLPPEIGQDKAFAEKYLIESELGVGGSGCVVVGARHRELDERVAIKFLLPEGSQNEEAVARFRREARAAARITSQHVVRIRDISTTDRGIPYIVMEYLEGVDLERMLQQCPNGQLPVPDAIEFVLQACEALAECHCLGIVHRDLKPSNLFCVHGADGLPLIKVLDFGISKLSSKTIDTAMTDQTRILGSPRYMSPEQFDSSADVDPRTDIWSIGVILYELFTGDVPFLETHVLKLWQSIRSDPPPPIEGLRPDLPAALVPVVSKCLEKDRAKRYANVAELAKALAPFAPQRARASVQRIIRTVESPGVTTGMLDLPPSDHDRTSDMPTAESVPASRRAWQRAWAPVALVLPVLVGITFWAVLRFGQSAPDPNPFVASPQVVEGPKPSPSHAAAPGVAAPPAPDLPTVESRIPAVASASSSTPRMPDLGRPRQRPSRHETPSKLAEAAASVGASQPAAESAQPAPPAASTTTPSPWIVPIVPERKGSK